MRGPNRANRSLPIVYVGHNAASQVGVWIHVPEFVPDQTVVSFNVVYCDTGLRVRVVTNKDPLASTDVVFDDPQSKIVRDIIGVEAISPNAYLIPSFHHTGDSLDTSDHLCFMWDPEGVAVVHRWNLPSLVVQVVEWDVLSNTKRQSEVQDVGAAPRGSVVRASSSCARRSSLVTLLGDFELVFERLARANPGVWTDQRPHVGVANYGRCTGQALCARIACSKAGAPYACGGVLVFTQVFTFILFCSPDVSL